MENLEKAFDKVPRRNFLPEEALWMAEYDTALPIGFGQTNSQPTTVRLMLEWLEVEPGNKVLDVGSGSGWTTALLSHLVGPSGKVYAVEKIPELLRIGRDNCNRFGIRNAYFYVAGRRLGLPTKGPYDRILVSATAETFSEALLSQLKVGGKMVIPVKHDIWEIEKLSGDDFETIIHPGFIFVPLV